MEEQLNGKTKRTKSEVFTTTPIEFLTATHAIDVTTGEQFQITDTTYRVYTYMRNRYCWYLDNNKEYFESWENIAKAVGKSKDLFKRDSSNRPDVVLKSIGLLKTERVKGKKFIKKIVVDIEDKPHNIVFASNVLRGECNGL